MVELRHVANLGGQPGFVSGVTDLSVYESGGQLLLHVASRLGAAGPGTGGLSNYLLSPGTQAQLRQDQPWVSVFSHLADPQIALLTLGNWDYVITAGLQGTGAGIHRIREDGWYGQRLNFGAGETFAPGLIGVTAWQEGGRLFVYAGQSGRADPLAYELIPSEPRLIALSPPAPVAAEMAQGPGALITASVAGQGFVITAAAGSGRVAVHAIGAGGALDLRTELLPGHGIGINTPSALAMAEVAGESYLIVAGAGSSSLTVLRLAADGALTPTDHVLDDLTTRFAGVSALETVMLGDRAYVLAGGGDDGISLFTLLPGGRLVHLASLADTAALSLAKVSAIAGAALGERLQIFVASGAEPGISQFEFDPGPLGLTLTAGAGGGWLRGGAAGDILIGGAGNDTIEGGAGADILYDGGGEDRLYGGAGADIFVLAADGRRDWIMDYQPGIDRLDLSGWPMLTSHTQLQIVTTAEGARITYRDEVLEIVSHDRSPIPVGYFTDAVLFNLSRVGVAAQVVSGVAPEFESGIAPELIEGGPGNDRLEGGSGDDTIHGGAGRDTILGGAGDDLLFGGAGDDLLGGGPGNDTLHGDAGHDSLYGADGDDVLYGGAGDDLLEGGQGDDLLYGGAGNDSLYGGAGRDTLHGGEGNDLLGGGEGDDMLFGEAGHDVLYGAAGNDSLYGGAGDDTLHGGNGHDLLGGGEGDDVLFGGWGWDTLYGADGNDSLYGEGGNDVLYGGNGHDLLGGGEGDDVLFGGWGWDTLYGADGNDSLYGEGGNDVLYGGNGDDLLGGGEGDDLLYGGPGDDSLYGAAGNDTLYGGMGVDLLFGGAGADVFVFLSAAEIGIGAARDTIGDFQPGLDRIDLSAMGLRWIGAAGFSGGGSGAGQLRFVSDGANGFLTGDVNGDRQADFTLFLPGITALAEGDLIL